MGKKRANFNQQKPSFLASKYQKTDVKKNKAAKDSDDSSSEDIAIALSAPTIIDNKRIEKEEMKKALIESRELGLPTGISHSDIEKFN